MVCSLHSICFNSPQLGYKTLDYWPRDMLSFNFSGKGLRQVSPPHFVHYFSRKMFLMLHSINWPNFIEWLPGCEVIKFEMKLIFLSKPLCYMTKKSGQKRQNEKSFPGEIKSTFHHFQRVFISKKLSQTWEFTFK